MAHLTRQVKGRPSKGRPSTKKPLNIQGLDLLHNQTLLSTKNGADKPAQPGRGCFDQQLSSLPTDLRHEELPIPPASDVPYALEAMLDRFRIQYMQMLQVMQPIFCHASEV